MSSVIEKNVLRLEVTVDDLESVETFQSAQQLRSIESRSVDIKSLFFLKMMEELATIHKCQDEIQFSWRLEREFQWHNERIVNLRKHRSLGEGVRDFGS